jgi:hypothetical protein
MRPDFATRKRCRRSQLSPPNFEMTPTTTEKAGLRTVSSGMKAYSPPEPAGGTSGEHRRRHRQKKMLKLQREQSAADMGLV